MVLVSFGKTLRFSSSILLKKMTQNSILHCSHIFLNRETKTKKSPLFRHNHHRNLMVGWFFRRYRYLYHAPHNLNSTTILSLITISGFMVYENFCPEIVRYPFFSYRHHLWTRTYQRVVKSNANLDIRMIC